jgi:hypothetical protein
MRTISKFSSCDLKTGLVDRRSIASVRPLLIMEVVVATSLNEMGRLSKLLCWFLKELKEHNIYLG